MENVVLTVHLILAVVLIGVVLLQRSEGGGLGMGGGGGAGGGVMTGRQAANALSRITWIVAGAFLVTSLALTVIAARNASNGSIVDQLGLGGQEQPTTTLPGIGEYAPPPAAGQPVLPPVPGAATTPAPATTAPSPAQTPATAPVTPPAAQAPEAAAPATQAPAAETPAAPAPAPSN